MSARTADTRLEDVEVKVAFLENTLSQLDEVIRELADDNARMSREIQELRERLQAGLSAGGDLDPEAYQVPPHY